MLEQCKNFVKKLKNYFKNTPIKKVTEDWDKTKEFDKIEPTVKEFTITLKKTEKAKRIGKKTCKICGGKGKSSKALDNQYTASDDFGNDAGQPGTTMSKNGKAVLITCVKCSDCGHSWIPK